MVVQNGQSCLVLAFWSNVVTGGFPSGPDMARKVGSFLGDLEMAQGMEYDRRDGVPLLVHEDWCP
jgi:hypothetical protein